MITDSRYYSLAFRFEKCASTSFADGKRLEGRGNEGRREGSWRRRTRLFSLRTAYLISALLFHLVSVTMETSEFSYSNATDDGVRGGGGVGGGGGQLTSAEVCQMETFQASCPEESPIIIVQEAHLGRLKLGRCVTESFGYLGCSLDVLPEIDVYCSGRRSCDVKVDDSSFKRKVPHCHKDLKNYLQVTYRCIKVILPTPNCDPIEVASGFLSSQITESTGCGLTNSPWIVQVGAGQRINVTLYDFSHDASAGATGGGGGGGELAATPSSHQTFPRTCRVYATIRDSSSSVRSLKMCGWQGRIINVYVSNGHRVEIRIMSGKTMMTTMTTMRPNYQQLNNNPQFLLYFEAVGCPDLRVPDSMRMHRHGNTVTVSCHGNDDLSWPLVCSDSRWIGNYGNCDVENHTSAPGLHYAASTIILVVIAAIVSSLILIIGVFCIKWKKRELDNVRRLQVTTYPYTTGDYNMQGAAISPDKLTPESAANFVATAVASAGGDATGNEYARMRIMCLPHYDVGGPPGYDVDARYGMPTVEHIYESPDCLNGHSPEGRRVYATRVHQAPIHPIHDAADVATRAGSVASSTRQPKVNLTQGRTGASTPRLQGGTKSKTGGNYSL